jgi:hypothetical protein
MTNPLVQLFGRSTIKEEKPTVTPQQTVGNLQNLITQKDKRIEFLQQRIIHEIIQAKNYMKKKNQNAAKQCVLRKKRYEYEIQKLNSHNLNLTHSILEIEGQIGNKAMIDAMTGASVTLKGLTTDMKPEDVEEDLENLNDTMQIAHEISDKISEPLIGPDSIENLTEADLLEELGEYEAEDKEEEERDEDNAWFQLKELEYQTKMKNDHHNNKNSVNEEKNTNKQSITTTTTTNQGWEEITEMFSTY